MCNHHSSVMFALHCVNTEIKMQAAHVKYTEDEHIFFSFHISATLWITPWFWQNLQNISQTNLLHATWMLQYCSVSLKKWVELRMCHNPGHLVWRQCGRIWKMGLLLQWKMRTPPHVIYPQYWNCFAKCSNEWSTTLTNHISFLITLFYFRFTRFFF